MFNSIEETTLSLQLSSISALLLTFVYIFAMSYYSTALAYVSIFLTEAGLLIMGSMMIFNSAKIQDQEIMAVQYAGGCILLGFGLIFSLVLYGLWDKVQAGIAIIDAAADFFANTKRLVIVSLAYSLATFAVIALWGVGFIFVVSMSEITVSSDTPQGKNIQPSPLVGYLMFIMCFGLVWTLLFLGN